MDTFDSAVALHHLSERAKGTLTICKRRLRHFHLGSLSFLIWSLRQSILPSSLCLLLRFLLLLSLRSSFEAAAHARVLRPISPTACTGALTRFIHAPTISTRATSPLAPARRGGHPKPRGAAVVISRHGEGTCSGGPVSRANGSTDWPVFPNTRLTTISPRYGQGCLLADGWFTIC